MSDALPTDELSDTQAADGVIANIARALHWLGIYVALPVLTGLVGLDVFLRYVLVAPLPWGNEVGALLLLVVFLASLPYCTHLGGHIRMDLFYARYSARAKRRADAVSALCGLGLAGPLAYQSFAASIDMFRLGEGADMIELPFWPFAALLGLSASIVCLQFLAAMLRGVLPGSKDED